MKQVTQRLRDGQVEVLEVPVPAVSPEGVLVDVRASLLSAGTERIEGAGRRARTSSRRPVSRPDQVAVVLEKARRDGIKDTIAAVRTRLDEPSALGYSAAGRRAQHRPAGPRPGPRGPRRLRRRGLRRPRRGRPRARQPLRPRCPTRVSFEQGAFATVGAIAMHGVRQADVRLGERVAVIGLGLVGQLAGMLLRAAGCTVVGVDLDDDAARARARGRRGRRSRTARRARPEPPAGRRRRMRRRDHHGRDGLRRPGRARRRAVPRPRARRRSSATSAWSFPRAPYYDKEIDLRLSRSYGPGRYDRTYEERGHRLPDRLRALDRAAQHGGLRAARRRRAGSTSRASSPSASRSTQAPAAYDRLVVVGGVAAGDRHRVRRDQRSSPPRRAPASAPARRERDGRPDRRRQLRVSASSLPGLAGGRLRARRPSPAPPACRRTRRRRARPPARARSRPTR